MNRQDPGWLDSRLKMYMVAEMPYFQRLSTRLPVHPDLCYIGLPKDAKSFKSNLRLCHQAGVEYDLDLALDLTRHGSSWLWLVYNLRLTSKNQEAWGDLPRPERLPT